MLFFTTKLFSSTGFLCLLLSVAGQSLLAQTFSATGLPASIPDGLPSNCWVSPGTPLTSTITVSGMPGTISATTVIKFNLKLSHSWIGDIRVTVTPPTGTPITLISRLGQLSDSPCGSSFDFSQNNLLSISASHTNTIAITNPISAGNYVPTAGFSGLTGSLNNLVGLPFNGDWVLTVVDGTVDDIGNLHLFEIVFSDPCTGFTSSVSSSSQVVDCFTPEATLTATPGSATSYQWSSGATPNADNTATIQSAGTYTVTVTGDFGCTASSSVTVANITCVAPSIVNNATVVGKNATIKWPLQQCYQRYRLQYRNTNVPNGTWLLVLITNPSLTQHTLTNLPNATYQWALRGLCTSNNVLSLAKYGNNFTVNAAMEQQPTDVTQVMAYPNPATNTLRVSWSPLENTTSYVRLIDQLGRTITVQTVDADYTDLDVSSYPNGMYHLQVIRSGEHIETLPLIISH